MTTISPFGSLPQVSLHSLHKAGEDSYTFVLLDGTLSLQKGDTPTLRGETDLAKISKFVQEHLDELPAPSKSLIPHQLNFLIEKHNEKGGEENPLIGRIQTPMNGGDLLLRPFLQNLSSFLVDANERDGFQKRLEGNLALYERVAQAAHTAAILLEEEARKTVHQKIYTSPRTTEEPFPLLKLHDDLLLEVSKFAPLCFYEVNKRLHQIYQSDANQQQLLTSFRPIERFWPNFVFHPRGIFEQIALPLLLGPTEGEEGDLSTLEKNEAIFKEIERIFAPRTVQQIIGKETFTGASEEIEAINAAYRELEDKATIALFKKVATGLDPNLSIANQASAVRTWMDSPQGAQTLSNVRELWMNQLPRIMAPHWNRENDEPLYRESGEPLVCIPKEIEKFPNLTGLFLRDHNIKMIPRNLKWPQGLTQLHLEGNDIVSFPENAAFPPRMMWIRLNRNPLSSTPKSRTNPNLEIGWDGSTPSRELLLDRYDDFVANTARTVSNAIAERVHPLVYEGLGLVTMPIRFTASVLHYGCIRFPMEVASRLILDPIDNLFK